MLFLDKQPKEVVKQIVATHTCNVCGERVSRFIDFNTGTEFIACKDYTRTHHEGIGRQITKGQAEEENYQGGIRRMTQLEQAHGLDKTKALAKYQASVTLTERGAMEILDTIWPEAPATEKKAAALLCAGYKLNPLMGHVFLIKFNKKRNGQIVGETWARVLGIKAKGLISSRGGAIKYLDMSPRIMTDDEQITVWGKVDQANICFLTRLQDASTEAEAYGYGKWPNTADPYGTDKGNTKENMAGIRSESQALDRLRPGEMPSGVEVMDAQYMGVDDPTQTDVISPVEIEPALDVPTTDELRELFKVAEENGWEPIQVSSMMIALFDKEKSQDLTRKEAAELLTRLEAGPKEETAPF